MLRPVRVTPPAEYPVRLRDVIEHLRIETGPEDYLIQSYIAAATAYLDGYSGVLGRCLIDQTWRQDFSDWSGLRLPFPDCKEVVVTWRDAAGVVSTVAPADYWLEPTALGVEVKFASGWSSPSLPSDTSAPVSVTFTAGYGAQSDVPVSIKQAILLMVGQSYRYREAVSDEGIATVPLAFDALISPHRVIL